MGTLDLFNNPIVEEPVQTPINNDSFDFFNFDPQVEPEVTPETPEDLVLNVQDKPNGPNSTIKNSPVYFGKAFEYGGLWTLGKMYYNDNHRVTFVSYKNCLLACNQTHEAVAELEPVIRYNDAGVAISVDNIYWTLVLTGESLDSAAIQTAIMGVRNLVYGNIQKINTNDKAISAIGQQTNTLLDHVDRIELKDKETDKELAKINAAIDANIAFPWIGSEDEFDALTEKDPDKFYFVYEE